MEMTFKTVKLEGRELNQLAEKLQKISEYDGEHGISGKREQLEAIKT